MSDTVAAVKPEALLVELPHVPDWFMRELAQVATRNGRPVFRLVDGQRETKWRNGKTDVKHLLQHEQVPAYVPVIRQVFRRKNPETGKYSYYPTHKLAVADNADGLSKEIDYTNMISVRGVGRACWIIEVYIDPSEVDALAWEKQRFADLQVHGVLRKVDVLGPYPREGTYVYGFSVIDEEGNAISPNQRTLDECKKRWRTIIADTSTVQDNINAVESGMAEFEKKQVTRIADNFYQYQGISAKRLHHGAISKPITKIYE